MNSTLKTLTGLAALVATAACNIDRAPTGVPVSAVVARMTENCIPNVTFTMPNDPGMVVHTSNITVDTCSDIMPPPTGEVPEGKYCPVILRPHLPIGMLAEYRIDSVTGPNVALRDSLNQHINHIVRVEFYPKYKQGGITAPTTDLSNLQEGTWLRNVADFDPTAPANILNSNATQIIMGNPGGNWDKGFDRYISFGRVVVNVSVPGTTAGQYVHPTFSNQSRMWLIPQAGVQERTFEVPMVGHPNLTANPAVRQQYIMGSDNKLYGPFKSGESVTTQQMYARPFGHSLLKYNK